MKWPTAEQLTAACPLADGYSYEVMRRTTVDELVAALRMWQPSWSVGAASVYSRPSYYEEAVHLEDGTVDNRAIFVVLLRHGQSLAGMIAAEVIPDALSLYGSLAALAPEHRGSRTVLMFRGADYFESLARLMNCEFVFALATLKHPASQRYVESMGYQLIGFLPGYDREEVSPGVVVRVMEAAYAKVLVPEDALLQPRIENMTPTVRRLYETLYPLGWPSRAA